LWGAVLAVPFFILPTSGKLFSEFSRKLKKKLNSRLNTTKLVNFLGFDTINTPKPDFEGLGAVKHLRHIRFGVE